MNFNYLLWDNSDKLPFPDEIQYLLRDLNWKDHLWIVNGLNYLGATYNMLDGKILYLNSLPDGSVKIERQTLIGEIILGSYFVDKNPNGRNAFISFRVTLVDGELRHVKLEEIVYQSAKEYQDVQNKQRVYLAMRKKFWFKFLYTPWFYFWRSIHWIVNLIINLFIWCFSNFIKLLTPYE